MKDLPARLRALRVVLKSGEYDGADLMRAWCAMAQAADEIERLELQLTAMSTGSEDENEHDRELLRNFRDAARYRRLRVLGCAVMNTPQLSQGTVSRFTNLDGVVDADLRSHPERGE